MTVILNDEEFSEAVECYVNRKGFSTEDYNVDCKVIKGMDGNRVEIYMDKKEGVAKKIEVPDLAAPFKSTEPIVEKSPVEDDVQEAVPPVVAPAEKNETPWQKGDVVEQDSVPTIEPVVETLAVNNASLGLADIKTVASEVSEETVAPKESFSLFGNKPAAETATVSGNTLGDLLTKKS